MIHVVTPPRFDAFPDYEIGDSQCSGNCGDTGLIRLSIQAPCFCHTDRIA